MGSNHQKVCSICLDVVSEPDDLKYRAALRCGHVYHPHCILSWLERSPTCPVCRGTHGGWKSESQQARGQSTRRLWRTAALTSSVSANLLPASNSLFLELEPLMRPPIEVLSYSPPLSPLLTSLMPTEHVASIVEEPL